MRYSDAKRLVVDGMISMERLFCGGVSAEKRNNSRDTTLALVFYFRANGLYLDV